MTTDTDAVVTTWYGSHTESSELLLNIFFRKKILCFPFYLIKCFFSAVLYAFFCCTAQFHYPFHFYFQRKLPSLKRIGVNYTCATNAVLPCNIQCGFKHKISSKTAKFKKREEKKQTCTNAHCLSSAILFNFHLFICVISLSLTLFLSLPGLSPSQTPISQALMVMSTLFSPFYSTTFFYSLFLCLKCCYCFGKAHHDMVLVALAGTLPNQVSICYTYYCGVCRSL